MFHCYIIKRLKNKEALKLNQCKKHFYKNINFKKNFYLFYRNKREISKEL